MRSVDRQHYRIREKRGRVRPEYRQKLQARSRSALEEDAAYLEKRIEEAEGELQKRSPHTSDASDREISRLVDQLYRRNVLLDERNSRSTRSLTIPAKYRFNDPSFKYQWYLVNTGELFDDPENKRADLNVLPAWVAGLNGTGVLSVVVDDGIETTNKDLYANYVRPASVSL